MLDDLDLVDWFDHTVVRPAIARLHRAIEVTPVVGARKWRARSCCPDVCRRMRLALT
jgi:hypothetical protein